MANDPAGKDPIDPMLDNQTDEDVPEDPFLTETLSNLSDIRVPSEFLPNVMFQVYERHHRDRLSWPQVMLISFILIVVSTGFFAWDVLDYMKAEGLSGFGTALDRKLDLVLNRFEGFLSAAGSVVSAGWQLLSGLFSETPITVQLGILGLLLIMIWLIKKAMAQLVP
ncbi:MAG: hypothetical protein QNK37_20445 [Acidobacteriota bacterium]|nr:hypothetical protein [Acidobacteriota bacterium]